jgi:hypothetical protein
MGLGYANGFWHLRALPAAAGPKEAAEKVANRLISSQPPGLRLAAARQPGASAWDQSFSAACKALID